MPMHFNLNCPLNRLWDQTLNEGVINTHGWKPAVSVIYLDMIYLSVYIYVYLCMYIYIYICINTHLISIHVSILYIYQYIYIYMVGNWF